MSNRGQKDDLENQIEFLKTFANARGGIVDCTDGNVSTIIIVHRDRFIRFGYEWFEKFLSKFGVEIIVVTNEKFSLQEELIQDLLSIVHVFSCRIYGLRKYKKKISEDKDL